MTVTPRVWLMTFLALVFMVGVSAGVWIDRVWLDHPGFMRGPGPGPGREGGRGRGPGGPPPPDRLIADLDRELDLSDAQENQIRQILDSQRATIRQLQEESRERFNAMQRDLDSAIAAVLTPEQSAKFKEWAARERAGPPRGGRRGW
jgi:Spy/CpxP family protein refolding chaperone